MRFELTIPDLQSGALAAWRRALSISRGLTRIRTDKKNNYLSVESVLIRVYLRPSAADLVLERKERFELSNRVWKTRMFPATSLPRAARIEVIRALVVG